MTAVIHLVGDSRPLLRPVAAANLALEAAIRHPEWAQAMLAELRRSQVETEGDAGAAILQAGLSREVEELIRLAPVGVVSSRPEPVGFES